MRVRVCACVCARVCVRARVRLEVRTAGERVLRTEVRTPGFGGGAFIRGLVSSLTLKKDSFYFYVFACCVCMHMCTHV